MKIEPAEQFAGKTAHALRPQGYGENVEALIAEHAPLVRKIAWQVHSRVSRTSDLEDLIQVGLIALIEAFVGAVILLAIVNLVRRGSVR